MRTNKDTDSVQLLLIKKSKVFFFNESKGEAESTFTSHSPVESLSMLFSAEAATEEQ